MAEIEDPIEISEYKYRVIDKFSEEKDWEYLDKPCFNYKRKKPYEIFKNREGKVCVKNTSYSGIIQLENVRLHFSTKVKTNLFYMLSFLKSEDEFLCDTETPIEIKEGANFFDIIGRLFLNEFEEIVKRGLLKKYIKKQENIGFLKGKLYFKGQIQNDINNNPKFSCIYDDLTVNNLENQIVLRALTLLIPMIRFNMDLVKDLKLYEHILKDFVELVDVSPSDCDKIHFSRLNEYYSAIIQFSKLILEENFIRSVYKGKSRGFNFIVNMNKVYEDFITEMVKEVAEDDFDEYKVVSQNRFYNLVSGDRKIITMPDIVLEKGEKIYPLIIDAKYKKDDKNTDYYQVIAYSLAIPKVEACCLIYPETEPDIIKTPLTLKRNITEQEGENVKLYAKTVDLHINNDLEFDDFVIKIKDQIKNIISECLDV